ncbi:MAG TPA: hypothetical protein VIN03_11885 [Roseateles sp.]
MNSITSNRERREWSLVPAHEHRDEATGLVHMLPAVIVEDGIGCIASLPFGGPNHDNVAIGLAMSAAPNLLFALQEIVGDYQDRFGKEAASTMAVVAMAQRAISKATEVPEDRFARLLGARQWAEFKAARTVRSQPPVQGSQP